MILFITMMPTSLLSSVHNFGQFWSHRLIELALAAAEFPARLEPLCLSRNDGKRPDGSTLGAYLVWDFRCPDTLAISHLHRASIAACTVAVDPEYRTANERNTQRCAISNVFIPLAVETLG